MSQKLLGDSGTHVARLSQVSEVKDRFLGEASTLGLGVGYWPEHIILVDNLNTGFTFVKDEVRRTDDGEIVTVEYLTRNGTRLSVLND